MTQDGGMRFAKGHGTGNDFVLLPDLDGRLDLTARFVAALCDRHFGIGADGVLRVVRCAAEPAAAAYADQAEWFMDYRNADGSIAEMCGNGVRVFARYLVTHGLASGQFPVATRAGLVHVAVGAVAVGAGPDTDRNVGAAGAETHVTVTMPVPVTGPPSRVRLGAVDYAGTAVDVGNPHLVCPVPDVSTVDFSAPPVFDPVAFPRGANAEFVTGAVAPPGADLAVRMRVYERGSAETLSCGTGACAVAAVALRDAGRTTGRVAVDLPGGRLLIDLDPDRCLLVGPAVLVAEGELYPLG